MVLKNHQHPDEVMSYILIVLVLWRVDIVTYIQPMVSTWYFYLQQIVIINIHHTSDVDNIFNKCSKTMIHHLWVYAYIKYYMTVWFASIKTPLCNRTWVYENKALYIWEEGHTSCNHDNIFVDYNGIKYDLLLSTARKNSALAKFQQFTQSPEKSVLYVSIWIYCQ